MHRGCGVLTRYGMEISRKGDKHKVFSQNTRPYPMIRRNKKRVKKPFFGRSLLFEKVLKGKLWLVLL